MAGHVAVDGSQWQEFGRDSTTAPGRHVSQFDGYSFSIGKFTVGADTEHVVGISSNKEGRRRACLLAAAVYVKWRRQQRGADAAPKLSSDITNFPQTELVSDGVLASN